MASPIIWSDITDAFPSDAQLAAASLSYQTLILLYVNDELDVGLFGGEDAPKTKLARIFLAAHFGKMVALSAAGGSGGGLAGPMISSTAGGLTRTFANLLMTGGQGSFSQTGYGQQFEALLLTTVARFGFVT